MNTLQDITDLEDSGWGDDEIQREVEIRRGLSPESAKMWIARMRASNPETPMERVMEQAEASRDWHRENSPSIKP